jgi:hypothetical protein
MLPDVYTCYAVSYPSKRVPMLDVATCCGGYCPFTPKWEVVFVDPLPSKMRTEGNFQARFSRRKSIGF